MTAGDRHALWSNPPQVFHNFILKTLGHRTQIERTLLGRSIYVLRPRRNFIKVKGNQL